MKIIPNNKDTYKLQQGGSIPYASFTNVSVSPEPQPADMPAPMNDQKVGKASQSLLPKEVFKYLFENGLPSDISEFTNKMSTFLNADFNALSENDIFQQQLMLTMEVSRIAEGKRRLKIAQENAVKNGTIHSIAINNSGMFYIMDDDGKVKLTNKLKQGDRALTNGDLIGLRAELLPHANNISDTISNGVGFESIQSKVNSVIEKLGSETMSGQNMYIANQNNEVLKGIGLLLGDEKATALGAKGQYKVTTDTQSNVSAVQSALHYLYSSLSNVEKQYLEGMAALNGLDSGINMLQSALSSKIVNKDKTSLDYKELDFNEDGTIKSKSDKESLTDMNPALMHILGMGGIRSNYRMSLGSTEYSIPSIKWASPTTADKKPLSDSVNAKQYLDSVLQSYYDPSQVFFGDKKIDENRLSQMVLNGNSLNKVDLPVKADGQTPNYDLIYSIDKAKEELNKEKNRRARQGIEPLSKEHEIEFIKSQPIYNLDEDGTPILSEDPNETYLAPYITDDLQPNPNLMKPFFTFNAFAGRDSGMLWNLFGTGKGMSEEYDNGYLVDIEDMENIDDKTIINKFDKLQIDNKYGIKGGVVTVAIPEGMEEYAASATGSKVTMPASWLDHRNIEKNRYANQRKIYDREVIKGYVDASSDKLK